MLSKSCIRDYTTPGIYQKEIAQYEKMIRDSAITFGLLDSTGVEKKQFGHTTYEFGYRYKVNGNDYRGWHAFYYQPEQSIVKVFYLKNDPSISSVNAVDKLETYNKMEEGSHSRSTLYTGIGCGVVCLILLIRLIGIMTGRIEPQPEPEPVEKGPGNDMGY